MPIHLEVFHPDRIAVGVARGEISLAEYQKLLMDIVAAGLLHYRKMIDVTAAVSSTVGRDELLAAEERLRAKMEAANVPRGPLAIVADRKRGDLALVFKEMSSKDRPVEVFRTVREARQWLLAQPVRQPPTSKAAS
ncbi:MAG: hypothetical protein J0H44_01355 [Alphaproteobacteria bacterium]|nr:hypothetical protein [Alphaproteobacteria bacterium]